MEKSCLRKRITSMFRRSSLGSTCSLRSRSTSDSVQEPIFLSSRRLDDPEGLDRSLSSLSTCRGDLPQRLPAALDYCGGCRHAKDVAKKEEAESRAPATLPLKEWLEQSKDEKREKKQKKERSRARLLSNGYGFTSSFSGESDDGNVLFSSDENEGGGGGGGRRREAEPEATFFSTRSFSSDSSEFYYSSSRPSKKKSSRHRKPKRGSRRRQMSGTGEGFRPLISMCSSAAATKTATDNAVLKDRVGTGEGLAVVKKSRDPYADFRSSMVEMIVAEQMFGAEQLERLLCSYLSLNSKHHHPMILRVYSDICDVLFGN